MSKGTWDSLKMADRDLRFIKMDGNMAFSLRRRVATWISQCLDSKDEFNGSTPEEKIKKLISSIEALKKLPKNDIDLLTSNIYNAFIWLEWKVNYDLEDFDTLIVVLLWEYYSLTKLSKMKVALFWVQRLFKLEYQELPEIEKAKITEKKFVRENVKNLLIRLETLSYPIISNLYNNFSLRLEYLRFYEAFIWEVSDDSLLTEMSDENTADSDIFSLIDDFPNSWLKEAALKRTLKIATKKQIKFSSMLNWTENKEEDHVDIDNFEHSAIEANWYINPNWFLYDIGVTDWFKVFWEDKTRYLFWKYFWKIIEDINSWHDLDSKLPEFYNIFSFRLKKEAADLKWKSDSDSLTDIHQHIIEWDIPKDWDEAWLEEIWNFMKDLITDINLNSFPYKEFKHPVKTIEWRTVFRWYFSWVKDFENPHIILLKWRDENVRKLRFACDYGQDMFIYFILQISHYLKHKKFINKKQLYTLIYRNYNLLTVENQKVYDIKMFEEQYENLIENVIWPLSNEYIAEHWAPWVARNTLLVGLYGTWKSQILFNLLKNKTFKHWDMELHLNANTININIFELIELIQKDISVFKKRLSDIHDNTKLPIILVIEDIETIVNEQGVESDWVTQALTTFFEWLWSMPITMVASTNYPERLPNRLIRPKRLENIIKFDIPLPLNVIDSTLRVHIESNLKEIFETSWIDTEVFISKYIPLLNNFTTSHIADFISKIKDKYRFMVKKNKDSKLTDEIMKTIFDDMLVPKKDIEARQSGINAWYKWIKSWGWPLWFHMEKDTEAKK
jgi:hypothetical protein